MLLISKPTSIYKYYAIILLALSSFQVREMRRFYVEYIMQDSIGVIANAFLVNSDIFGINSDVSVFSSRKKYLFLPIVFAYLH